MKHLIWFKLLFFTLQVLGSFVFYYEIKGFVMLCFLLLLVMNGIFPHKHFVMP